MENGQILFMNIRVRLMKLKAHQAGRRLELILGNAVAHNRMTTKVSYLIASESTSKNERHGNHL